MHEYSNLEYFFALDFLDAAEIIKAMNERRMDDYLFERWIPYQDQMSFDDFKSQTVKNKESREAQKKYCGRLRKSLILRTEEFDGII